MTAPGTGEAGSVRKDTASRSLWWPALALLIFAFLAAGNALTKRPWIDEAWFANPAFDLATHGRMGTHVLEPTGSHLSVMHPGLRLERIEQHTYWVMPLHLVLLALCIKLFGFGLAVVRLPALVWGLGALAAWYVIVRRMGGPKELAALTLFLIGVDFAFVNAASDGRMDMMSASLGFIAIAIYLSLRETRLRLAILLSQSAAALSVWTHPNGIMASVSLVVIFLYLDRNRFSWRIMPHALAPYLACGLGWAMYVLQDRTAFAAQLGANASIRRAFILEPLESVRLEIVQRYLENHFWPPDSGAGARAKIIVFIAYCAAVLIMIAVPAIRRHSGYRLLLYLAGLRFLMMAWGTVKNDYYLVHIIPFLAFFLACASSWLWGQSKRLRWIVVPVLSVVACVQLSWSLYKICVQQPYQKQFLPVVRFLKGHTSPDEIICGSAELAFAFGFDNPHIVDDAWMGRWSGRRPDILVVDRWYYYQLNNNKKWPEHHAYVTSLLKNEFHEIYSQTDRYQIYRRNPATRTANRSLEEHASNPSAE